MALADYEFSRPDSRAADSALGHIMLTGRADIAALAMNPKEATPEEIRACANKAAETMEPRDAEAYLGAVATVFPQVNQRSN